MLLPFFMVWSVVAYAHFFTGYAGRNTDKIIKLGYSWLTTIFVLVAFGYLSQGLNLLNDQTITVFYGYVLNSVVLVSDLFLLLHVFFVVKFFRNATEPEERNRTMYLLFALYWNMFPTLRAIHLIS